MFWSRKKHKLLEWEAKVLNISASVMNEQRTYFLASSAADPEFFHRVGQLGDATLVYFENGFLWGLYKATLHTCPVKVDEASEIKRLIELRALLRGVGKEESRDISEAAEFHARSENKFFDQLGEIGNRAILNPELMADALTIYFREVLRENAEKIGSSP